MYRFLGALSATLLLLAGCSSGGDSADPSISASTLATDGAEEGAVEGGSADRRDSGQGVDQSAASLAFVDGARTGEFVIEVSPDAPRPTSVEVKVLTGTPDGETVGDDGVVLLSYVAADWNGTIVQRSNDLDERLSIILGDPTDAPPDALAFPAELQRELTGQTVGSRLIVALPAGLSGMPQDFARAGDHLMVLDILAFQAPEAS